jgi:hypothetical protein
MTNPVYELTKALVPDGGRRVEVQNGAKLWFLPNQFGQLVMWIEPLDSVLGEEPAHVVLTAKQLGELFAAACAQLAVSERVYEQKIMDAG